MSGTLVDSNVILDVFTDDPRWADWSQASLEGQAAKGVLCINPVIYAEVSIGFAEIEACEHALAGCGFQLRPTPKEALFLAGKAFLDYRRRRGTQSVPLPDFFIGAHAAVENLPLLTRNAARYRTYFPTVRLLTPNG